MTNGDDSATEIQRVPLRQFAQKVRGATHVFEERWPVAARACAAVFDVPCRYAGAGEGRRKRGHVVKINRGSPASPVNDDSNGEWPPSLWEPEIAELRQCGTVVDSVTGGRFVRLPHDQVVIERVSIGGGNQHCLRKVRNVLQLLSHNISRLAIVAASVNGPVLPGLRVDHARNADCKDAQHDRSGSSTQNASHDILLPLSGKREW